LRLPGLGRRKECLCFRPSGESEPGRSWPFAAPRIELTAHLATLRRFFLFAGLEGAKSGHRMTLSSVSGALALGCQQDGAGHANQV